MGCPGTSGSGQKIMADQVNYLPASQKNIFICCITFNSTDRIRLIGVPQEITSVLRSAITDHWGEIKSEGPYHGIHQFKLRGNPWEGHGEENVRSQSLVVGILTSMAKNGWNLLQSAGTSKKDSDKIDKDALYFELTESDPGAQLFGLSFNKGDRIRLNDANEHIASVLISAISSRIEIQKQKNYYGSLELKLSGYPWINSGAEGVGTRMLLCQVIANFRAAGYKLYASVDISSGGSQGSDLDTWVFRRVAPPYWQ